jgi:hypothetical protein
MKCLLITLFAFVQLGILGQFESTKGLFSLGVRNTYGFFGSSTEGVSAGVGGQFRIQLTDQINTEWYADYISYSNNVSSRLDYQVGWSVMYYVLPESGPANLFQPFIEAGHYFDYTQVSVFGAYTESGKIESLERWSSAVQLGLGTHVNFTERFDLSLKTQYMIHLGSDLHTSEIIDGHAGHEHKNVFGVEKLKGTSLEGHLLLTLSANYKIGNLWGRK